MSTQPLFESSQTLVNLSRHKNTIEIDVKEPCVLKVSELEVLTCEGNKEIISEVEISPVLILIKGLFFNSRNEFLTKYDYKLIENNSEQN